MRENSLVQSERRIEIQIERSRIRVLTNLGNLLILGFLGRKTAFPRIQEGN